MTATSNGPAAELAQLRDLVAQLQERVDRLEAELAQHQPELNEETLLAISAAVAAYLGKRATIKQVHLRRGGAWVSQGRAAGQQIHADPRGMR